VSTIGKYQVLERISTGDVAEIFKARLEGIAGFRRLFAIKRIRPHLARNDAYTQFIEEEARIAGLLSHSNIVQLLDLGRDAGVLYLVMEFVDGWDLGRVLEASRARGTPMPVAHACSLAASLLKALEYAHQREVMRDGETVPLRLIHRDVSPSNILLSKLGEVKLTDFGIARASLKMMQTRPDLLRRTFDYMSPEAARGGELTQSADLFAVGLVLYECLTLVHPFRRDGEMATLEAIQAGTHEPLADLCPAAPPELCALVESSLAVDPAHRPASATAFKDALLGVLIGSGEVFTQENMAAWLGELLASSSEDPPVRSRPMAVAMLPGEDLPDLPAEADATGPARLSDVDDDDVHTVVVGQMPALKPLVMPVPEEEGATVVNPELAARLEAIRKGQGGVAPAAESGPDQTRVRNLPAPKPALADAGSAWVAGVVSGGLALVIGGLIGAVATVAYVRSGGMMVNPPLLDIRTDPGVKMEVQVDGVPANSGAQRLEPGKHPVRVSVAGASAWEFDLELQSGEYRVMVITAHQASTPTPVPHP
jgi:serine/threonine-protein kinase